MEDKPSSTVWSRLAASAPLAPELVAALERYDPLSLNELESRLSDCEDALRRWASHPDNHGRPSRQAPRHIERVAVGTLLERRTWWE
jgi:hypothetical protein